MDYFAFYIFLKYWLLKILLLFFLPQFFPTLHFRRFFIILNATFKCQSPEYIDQSISIYFLYILYIVLSIYSADIYLFIYILNATFKCQCHKWIWNWSIFMRISFSKHNLLHPFYIHFKKSFDNVQYWISSWFCIILNLCLKGNILVNQIHLDETYIFFLIKQFLPYLTWFFVFTIMHFK